MTVTTLKKQKGEIVVWEKKVNSGLSESFVRLSEGSYRWPSGFLNGVKGLCGGHSLMDKTIYIVRVFDQGFTGLFINDLRSYELILG